MEPYHTAWVPVLQKVTFLSWVVSIGLFIEMYINVIIGH